MATLRILPFFVTLVTIVLPTTESAGSRADTGHVVDMSGAHSPFLVVGTVFRINVFAVSGWLCGRLGRLGWLSCTNRGWGRRLSWSCIERYEKVAAYLFVFIFFWNVCWQKMKKFIAFDFHQELIRNSGCNKTDNILG